MILFITGVIASLFVKIMLRFTATILPGVFMRILRENPSDTARIAKHVTFTVLLVFGKL